MSANAIMTENRKLQPLGKARESEGDRKSERELSERHEWEEGGGNSDLFWFLRWQSRVAESLVQKKAKQTKKVARKQ